MPLSLKSPGVYIETINAFPNSVVAIETAVPAFVGYTARVHYQGKDLLGQAVEITSLSEFLTVFGALTVPIEGTQPGVAGDPDQYTPIYHVLAAARPPGDIQLAGRPFELRPDPGSIYYLYNSLRLFYENGGGRCFVVSAGLCGQPTGHALPGGEPLVNPNVRYGDLKKALAVLEAESRPTLIAIPDALLLRFEEYQTLLQDVLNQCGRLRNRMGLFDVYGGDAPNPVTYFTDQIQPFRAAVGMNHLDFGAAYYPFIKCTVTSDAAINFDTLGGAKELQNVLPEAASDPVKTILATIQTPSVRKAASAASLESALLQNSPSYQQLHDLVRERINTLPTAGALAGIYTRVDSERGVWQAPANVNLAAVTNPTLNVTDRMQEDLNVDALTGKSINALRSFPGLGVLVWGARTLDGNSNDWRYINVRRTVIMIEQSVRSAAGVYVFEPNVASTWQRVQTMLENFLTGLWQQGALAGAAPQQAFCVAVGLGITMTSQDILDGLMNVTVKVAVTHPAEFIVFTVQQTMQIS